MAPQNKTKNQHFRTDYLGHIQTEIVLTENFAALDSLLGPKPTVADIGKTLVVVQRPDGSIGFDLETP